MIIVLGLWLSGYLGLRDITIGSDTDNYIYAFESGNYETVADPLFIFLNEVIRSLTSNYTALFLAASLITYGSFLYSAFKFSNNLKLVIFVFLILIFPISGNIMRQIMGMALLTYCIYASGWKKSKLDVRFYTFLTLASLSHFSLILPSFIYAAPFHRATSLGILVTLWIGSLAVAFAGTQGTMLNVIQIFQFVSFFSDKFAAYISILPMLPSGDVTYTLIFQNLLLAFYIIKRRDLNQNVLVLFTLVIVQNMLFSVLILQRYFFLFLLVLLIEGDKSNLWSSRIYSICSAAGAMAISVYLYLINGLGELI